MTSASPPAFRQNNVTSWAPLSRVMGLYPFSMAHYDVLSLLFKLLILIWYLKTWNPHLCYFLLNIVILILFSTYFFDNITIMHKSSKCDIIKYVTPCFISHFLVKRMVWHYWGLECKPQTMNDAWSWAFYAQRTSQTPLFVQSCIGTKVCNLVRWPKLSQEKRLCQWVAPYVTGSTKLNYTRTLGFWDLYSFGKIDVEGVTSRLVTATLRGCLHHGPWSCPI